MRWDVIAFVHQRMARPCETLRLSAPPEVNAEEAREVLEALSRPELLSFLDRPDTLAGRAVANLLVIATRAQENLTAEDCRNVPRAFQVVLRDHPDAMGVFTKAPAHRGPGSTPISHGAEILVPAALKLSTFTSAGGRQVHIHPQDELHFGIKEPSGYAQPRSGGTIEADIIQLSGDRVIAYDVKYSQSGHYNTTADLNRQLSGVRTKFRDGTLQEFLYVTPGVFGLTFVRRIEQANRDIVRDSAREHRSSIGKGTYGSNNAYAHPRELRYLPPARVTDPGLVDCLNTKGLRDFARHWRIPQVDYCEHVNFSRCR